MATYAAFKHVELHKVGHGKNRVPNAPRGCISEIFSDPVKRHANGNGIAHGNGVSAVDSPVKVRPRDTHSRLFGGPPPVAPPAVRNDTTRSHIQFGDAVDGAPQRNGPRASNGHTNGHVNGAVIANGHVSSPKKDYIFRNPVTGLGVEEPLQRRRPTQIARRGADTDTPFSSYHRLEPNYSHRYFTDPSSFVPSHRFDPAYSVLDVKPIPGASLAALAHIGLLQSKSLEPGLPNQLYLNPNVLKDSPMINDYSLLETPQITGPNTLVTSPPVLDSFVPGFVFEDHKNPYNPKDKTPFLDYIALREFEGNPVTGDGYKSLNGEINTSVTALNGNAMPINHNRIPPGGYSSGLW